MFQPFQNTNYSAFAAPVQKIFDLNMAAFSTVTSAQQELVKGLLVQTEECAKAAFDIKDFEDLAHFLKEQGEITQTNLHDIAESNKAAIADTQEYISKVQAILATSQTEIEKAVEAPKPQSVKKPSVKKALN